MIITFKQLDFERAFIGLDLGEGKNHLMAKAYGLKTNRKAKCKSCVFYQNNNCTFLVEGNINENSAACSRYQSKKSKRTITK